MPMRLNDVNSDASEAAFGFKATSASLKPVLSQVVFSNVLGSTHQSQDLFKFVEKPGKTPSSDLDENITVCSSPPAISVTNKWTIFGTGCARSWTTTTPSTQVVHDTLQ